jgi:cytochrome P450
MSSAPGFDPADSTFLADPHATFDALREHGGMVRDPLGWSAISYDACSEAFLDTALIPGIDPLLIELGHGALWGVQDQTLTDSEGEAHQRLRRAVAPWFTARRIGALRERTRELVDERLAGRDEVSLMTDLADVVPARLFCWMVGASDADAEVLAPWSKALLLVFTATSEMVAPVREAKHQLAQYTHDLLAHKRKHPGDDLTTALAGAAAAGDITEQDAYYLLEELLSASVDNTANTAGLALHSLAEAPAQWAALHAQPELLAPAVEECGRFQPAIRHTIKYAIADTRVAETAVAKGEYVTLRIAAAHRDPGVYTEPHTFDIARRQPKPQLAFGAGRHYCLGAALGKMEVQEMVGGLVSRWPEAEIGAGARLSIAASGHVHELPLRSAA